ncbi:MAG TPA: hypothetical protein PKD99_00620 [Sphingopyxis sp.]|nr:hypothetical protein [Sphingopyxis sp.]HMP43576.1 hypothetical protein [Sphingopyxis sp.]HMQ17569.1 hypothetical protein [Sphingopyxis sp.]
MRDGPFRRALPAFSTEEFNMKPFFAVAAFAAATLAAPVFAQEQSGGHYEWQTRQVPGPNKSNTNSRFRVWVKDKPGQMAHCDCDMMKVSPADCMKKMSGDHKMPPQG